MVRIIDFVVKNSLCTGCGACFSVCPYDAVSMKMFYDGTYRPYINSLSCKNCKLCERVCPSFDIDQRIATDGLGKLIRCYIGYSTNAKLRWMSSSGGLVTAILLSLLNDGVICGAVVATNDLQHPLKPAMRVVRSEEEITQAIGSKYCPVKPLYKVKDLFNEKGKIAVVGLPCHIWAFRKLEKVNEKLGGKILVHLGLFCSKSPNLYATHYFLRKVAGVDISDVAKMSYRGRGWPGKITITTKSGENLMFGLRDWIHFSYYPHFIPVRCALCYDVTNQLADISLGDAWGLAHDNIGTSVAIARTEIGEQILQYLSKKGKITLSEVSPEQVLKGQCLEAKVRKSFIRIHMWRIVFKQPTPFFQFTLENLSIKDWIANLFYCTLLFMSQNPVIRTALCNLTSQHIFSIACKFNHS